MKASYLFPLKLCFKESEADFYCQTVIKDVYLIGIQIANAQTLFYHWRTLPGNHLYDSISQEYMRGQHFLKSHCVYLLHIFLDGNGFQKFRNRLKIEIRKFAYSLIIYSSRYQECIYDNFMHSNTILNLTAQCRGLFYRNNI